ncbi:hypothetical protein HZA33_01325 [Candidatus Pacearchaeota archaeon]|nr:hypothetical protein [Candidatus Pacearchaeota archaeon]
MIKSIEPVNLVEVREILSKIDSEKAKDIAGFTKKFNKLAINEAKKLEEEIENLGLLKIKKHHIVKIVDILPVDTEDIHKIFIDVSLDQNEITQLLEVVKKYL